MSYKRINGLSSALRIIILVPAVIVLTLLFILRPHPAYPLWAIIIGGCSVGSYLGVMTYFCIKQKCYEQLARTFITIIVAIVTFLSIRQHI